MSDYGFGVVGCGVIAKFHVAALKEIENARLVAVQDVIERNARWLGEEQGADWYLHLEGMLAREDLDVVAICTPSGFHGSAAVKAADAGKHVVVEKPLETSLAKCDAIIDAAEKNGVKLCGIFPSRFHECNQVIKQAVDAGRLGELSLGSVYNKWWRTQEYYDSGGWRGTWKLDGGGALMNQGIHAIDLLLWMLGPVRSVMAYTDTLAHERIEVEDTATACLRFENGALGIIEGATSVYPGMKKRMELCGDKGTIVSTEEDILTWDFVEPGPDDDRIREEFADKGMTGGGASDPTAISHKGHKHQLEDMIRAIETDTAPAVDGHEARKAVELILAIYQSAQEQRRVELPLRRDPEFLLQRD